MVTNQEVVELLWGWKEVSFTVGTVFFFVEYCERWGEQGKPRHRP